MIGRIRYYPLTIMFSFFYLPTSAFPSPFAAISFLHSQLKRTGGKEEKRIRKGRSVEERRDSVGHEIEGKECE